MREGKDLILATRPFAVENRLRSWWCVISTFGLTAAALAGSLIAAPVLAKLACGVLAGFLLIRCFIIFHDYQHRTILDRSRVAKFVMAGFGLLFLSPPRYWRGSHNYHHKHNSKLGFNHIGAYPIITKDHYESLDPKLKRMYRFTRHPSTILGGYIFNFLLGSCIYPLVRNPKRHYDSLISILIHVAAAIAVVAYAGLSGLLFTVLIPFTISMGIGSYLFYAQHSFPGAQYMDEGGWTYEKAALESSSYTRMGRLLSWFTGNIGYHHVHHLNAKIPFYRLPETMAAIPELQHPLTTSLHPRDVRKCLSLHLWDSHLEKLVDFETAKSKAPV